MGPIEGQDNKRNSSFTCPVTTSLFSESIDWLYLNRPAQAKKITRRPIKTQPITPLDSPLVLFAWLPSGGYPRCPFVLLGLLLAFTTEQQEQRHDNDWITLTTLAHEVLLCPCSIVCSRQPAVSLLYAADRREHD